MNVEDNQKLIDKMYNMALDATMLEFRQILFNPNKEQADKFWCKKCDGLHNTKKCKLKIS